MSSTDVFMIDNKKDVSILSKYKTVSPDDPKYKNYTHCSHAMIYARTNSKSLDIYDRVAVILMQMRFDGLIGFPGGGVDPGESPVEAVNREIFEELGWVEENGLVSESDYQFTHVDEESKLALHFFAVEVSEAKFEEIERNSMTASDYGNEVLGNFRIPLYTMGDSYRGLPAFLGNNFVGNAKAQLLESLIRLKITSVDLISKALTTQID